MAVIRWASMVPSGRGSINLGRAGSGMAASIAREAEFSLDLRRQQGAAGVVVSLRAVERRPTTCLVPSLEEGHGVVAYSLSQRGLARGGEWIVLTHPYKE